MGVGTTKRTKNTKRGTWNGILFELQKPLPVEYKGKKLDCGYRVDLVVAERLIVELKSVDKLSGIHEAQLITDVKRSKIRVGLWMDFNVKVLKDGLRRFVV